MEHASCVQSDRKQATQRCAAMCGRRGPSLPKGHRPTGHIRSSRRPRDTPGCARPATTAVSAGRHTPTPRPAHAQLAQLLAATVERSRCGHLTTNEYSQWRNQYSQGCSLPPCARPVVDTLERHRSSLCHRHDYNTPIPGDSATPTTLGDDSHPNPHRIVVVGIRAAAQAMRYSNGHPPTHARNATAPPHLAMRGRPPRRFRRSGRTVGVALRRSSLRLQARCIAPPVSCKRPAAKQAQRRTPRCVCARTCASASAVSSSCALARCFALSAAKSADARRSASSSARASATAACRKIPYRPICARGGTRPSARYQARRRAQGLRRSPRAR